MLDDGAVRFGGSLTALAAHARGTRYLLRVGRAPPPDVDLLNEALDGFAVLAPGDNGDSAHMLLTLAAGVSLGNAVAVLTAGGADVIACREERPPIEDAFLSLIGRPV